MSFKPLDLDLLRSPVRKVVCSPSLIDYKDMYRLRARERNENDKVSTEYPRDEYRGHVILPPYFDSRPSKPQSLGYGSNLSELTTSGYNLGRRVISDTTNSPTKKLAPQLNTSSSDHTRKVVIEHLPGRNKQQPSTSSTKENRSVIQSKQDRYHQESTRPDVFERLGPTLTPNLNAKRFKADTSKNTERLHVWEGTGEKKRSGYQSKQSQRYQSGYKSRHKQSEGSEKRREAENSGKRTDSTTKSANKQIFPEYNYELYSGEARAADDRMMVTKSNNYPRSDNKSIQYNNTKNIEAYQTKSRISISPIPVSNIPSSVPSVPPKIILKRKEIQISPTRPKSPEPQSNKRDIPSTQAPEYEEFEMINESQDLPAVGDETVTEVLTPRRQPITTPVNKEPQTRREPTGELMEDGSARAPTQAIHIQESVIKISEDSQSMDYEFIENLFSKQLSDESNIRVSPEEVTIYLRLPITSSQAAAPTQGRIHQSELEDLKDVSYIIMSPTTPNKDDITIDSESEKCDGKSTAVSA